MTHSLSLTAHSHSPPSFLLSQDASPRRRCRHAADCWSSSHCCAPCRHCHCPALCQQVPCQCQSAVLRAIRLRLPMLRAFAGLRTHQSCLSMLGSCFIHGKISLVSADLCTLLSSSRMRRESKRKYKSGIKTSGYKRERRNGVENIILTTKVAYNRAVEQYSKMPSKTTQP